MKRFLVFSPISILSFLLGISTVFLTTYFFINNPKPLPQKTTEKFAVNLERINLGDISILDTAYVGENKVLSLALEDGMRISNDGGKTWERMFVQNGGNPPQTSHFPLWNLSFIDSQRGWASGGCLISTKDGGQSWEEVKLPHWMDRIQVEFLNESVGYVAGSRGAVERGSGKTIWAIFEIFKTVNGGKTWQKSYSDKTYSTPWEIKILNETTALVVVDGVRVLRTENGGKSWKKVYDKFYGGVNSIAKAPDGKLWLFGNKNILTSTDFGKTWQQPENLTENIINHDWWSVDFNDNGLGVAVSEDAAIALTKDGGKTWAEVKSNLHVGNKIPAPNNPFFEQLRGIHLFKNSGIITGGQRDYIITFPE